MMTQGSTLLLRALRGESGIGATRTIKGLTREAMNGRRKRRYVPMAQRPVFDAPATIRKIINDVADAFGIPPEWMISADRSQEAVHARAVAIRLVRDRTWQNGEPRHSTTAIGRFFKREHSTICHTLRMFEIYARRQGVSEIYRRLSEVADG